MQINNKPILGIIVATILLLLISRSLIEILVLALNQWNQPILLGDSWRFLERNSSNNSISWLLSQHNEHRIFLSKLSTLIESRLLKVPVTQTAVIQNLALLMASCGAWSLLARRIIRSRRHAIITSLAGMVLILNPWQYENLGWEFQTPWFFINALTLSIGVTLTYRQQNLKTRPSKILCDFAIVLGPWLAIFSTGQGIAVGISLCISSWLHSKRNSLLSNTSFTFAAITYYFALNYNKPGYHPDYSFNLNYFFNQVSGGRWEEFGLILAIGILIIAIRPRILSHRYVSAITMPALFSILFAAMTTISRSGFGFEQSNASRYITHSVLIGLSCLLLVSIISIETKSPTWTYVMPGILVLLVIAPVSHIFNSNSLTFNKAFLNAQQDRARLDFICLSRVPAFKQKRIDLICNDGPHHKDIASAYFNNLMPVKPIGWHKTIMNISNYDLDFKSNKSNSKDIKFRIDNINQEENKEVKTTGWAYSNSNTGKNPLYLVINYKNSTHLAFQIDKSRPDVQNNHNLSGNKHGWEANFPLIRQDMRIESMFIIGEGTNLKIQE